MGVGRDMCGSTGFAGSVQLVDYDGLPVLVNYTTGAVVGLTRDGLQLCKCFISGQLARADFRAADVQLYTFLEDGGYLDESEFEGSDNSCMESAYLHVTQRCNLDCRGCYSRNTTRNRIPDPSLSMLERAVDGLSRCGVRRLIISGGEPFLREDLALLVDHAFAQHGIDNISILSNGLCIDDHALDALQETPAQIAVSFDGYSRDCEAFIRGEQRFDCLVSAVERIKRYGIPVHLIVTIHRKNYRDLAAYASLAEKLGTTFNYSIFTCGACNDGLRDLVPGDLELREIAKSLLQLGLSNAPMESGAGVALVAKKGCGAGIRTVSIDADGTIYPCHMFHAEEYALGNAFFGSIEDARRRLNATGFANYEPAETALCRDCSYVAFCAGGCRARAYGLHGDISALDPYCSLMKEFYRGLALRLRKMS